MILICSFCRKNLGEKEPLDNRNQTHGMCPECYEHMMRQVEGISFDEYLEAFHLPVVIVNGEGRVLAANNRVLALLDRPIEKVRGFLGGEALECAYAQLAEGCGNTVHCSACTIRRLVERTRKEKCDFKKQRVYLTTEESELEMIVSTSYRNGMVCLTIFEVLPVLMSF